MSFARTYDSARPEAGVFARIGKLLRYPNLVWQNRYTVQNFFQRELQNRFHGSFLGAWWMLMQPLFMFAVYYLVFGVLYARPGQGTGLGTALYLFSGIVCFHALVEATSTCCNIIVSNGNLVKKVAFPSEALPIHVALVSLVVYLVGAVLTLLVGTISGASTPGIELLYLPLVLALQFVLIVGVGLLLANANVFVRDVQQVWRIFATAWFFMSPVFWPPQLIIDQLGPEWSNLLFHLNPAYPLLMAQRIALLGELPALGVTDFWSHFGALSAWAFGFLLVGFVTFVGNKHKHADIV